MPKPYIGFARALRETLAHIDPGMPVDLPVTDCEGYVTAEDLFGQLAPRTSQ